jgi:hypothetical protein
MPAIDFERMKRVLLRCRELAESKDVLPIVRTVFADRLDALASEFVAAHDAMPLAESSSRKEVKEAREKLADLDQPYREARAVYLAYYPEAVLPETLRSQPTDTDKKHAVLTLLDRIDDNVGAGWADALLDGPFGKEAGPTVAEVDEAAAATAELAAARNRRARALGPAYEAYLAFKNVVRNTYGPKSLQYRRIHLRSDGSLADEARAGEATEAAAG